MKPSIIIRMGAAHWGATVHANGQTAHFNFRKMDKRERAAFHRELMNAVRSTRKTK